MSHWPAAAARTMASSRPDFASSRPGLVATSCTSRGRKPASVRVHVASCSFGWARAAPPPTLRAGPPSRHRPPSSGGRPTLRAGPATRCSAFAELIFRLSSRSVDKSRALMRAQRTPLRPGSGSNRFPIIKEGEGCACGSGLRSARFAAGLLRIDNGARPRRNAHPALSQLALRLGLPALVALVALVAVVALVALVALVGEGRAASFVVLASNGADRVSSLVAFAESAIKP